MRRLIPVVLLLLAATSFAQDDPGWLYLLSRDRAEIAVVPLSNPDERTTIELDRRGPEALFPTPGGKYVFVTFTGSPEVLLVDSESATIAGSLSFTAGSPESITFSPRGDLAIVRFGDSIAAYDHSGGALTLRTKERIPSAAHPSAAAAVNRRATRLYVATDDGLGYLVADELSLFETVDGGRGVSVWAMAPDYRFLWGVSSDGLVVVDERRARVVGQIEGRFVVEQPVFERTAGAAYVARRDRPEIAVIDDRRFRERAAVELPDTPVGLAGDESRGVWALTESGRLLRYDTAEGRLESIARLPGGFDRLTYVGFKPGGGFACF